MLNVPKIENIDQFSEYTTTSHGSRLLGQFFYSITQNDGFIHPGYTCSQWLKNIVAHREPANRKLSKSCPCTLEQLLVQATQYTIINADKVTTPIIIVVKVYHSQNNSHAVNIP